MLSRLVHTSNPRWPIVLSPSGSVTDVRDEQPLNAFSLIFNNAFSLKSGIGGVAGFLLSVTLSLDDYVIAAYTNPDSFTTISNLINKDCTTISKEVRNNFIEVFTAVGLQAI